MHPLNTLLEEGDPNGPISECGLKSDMHKAGRGMKLLAADVRASQGPTAISASGGHMRVQLVIPA